MIELPKEVMPPECKSPRRVVIFAQTKTGKTEAVSHLSNALLIDTENGSSFVSAMKINVKEEAKKQGTNSLAVIQQIGQKLDEYYKEHGKYPYDYLVVDTMTGLEESARIYATILYKNTPIGRSFAGADVVAELPNGGGQSWPISG